MAVGTPSSVTAFRWQPQPAAAALVRRLETEFRQACPRAAELAQRLRDETGTRFGDWVDHFHVPASAELRRALAEVGFVSSATANDVWEHPEGMFPRVMLRDKSRLGAALRVESVSDFVDAHDWAKGATIEGDPSATLRRAQVAADDAAELWIFERHGARGFAATESSAAHANAVMRHRVAFESRKRHFNDERQGFAEATALIRAASDELGVDRTTDLFFAAERSYWQNRNHAARVQRARQDQLGLGWGNHDHHTYRSSRACFAPLVGALEQLGFQCRERFYAGEEAGWGAQVLEQPQAGVIVFADVDLAPEEVAQDFAHEPLAPQAALGTVGLWCQLHGEAFLQAGMHHLEAQFDFVAAREQLLAVGIETMAPFTDFPFLRQAFTRGEVWAVDSARIERLRAAGQITAEQAEKFATGGAVGSHLEILERNDGYKGFNQTGISDIIRKTDPRTLER